MGQKQNKLMRKRLVSAYTSSVLSTSLVLLLLGVASLLLVNARNVSDYFKENMQVSVIFSHEVSEADALAFQKTLNGKEFVKNTEFISREQGVKEMEEMLGKDFLTVFDSSPIPVSVNVSLKAEYVTEESVDSIMTAIKTSPMVDDVVWQKSLIEMLNANLKTASLVISVFLILLMFISVVLINNTVRLNVFNNRFSIHTMRLVGATKAFIRRPFLIEALFHGVISAELAVIMMIGLLVFVKKEFELMFTIFQEKQFVLVIGIVLAAGILICVGATFLLVGHTVRLKKEELY